MSNKYHIRKLTLVGWRYYLGNDHVGDSNIVRNFWGSREVALRFGIEQEALSEVVDIAARDGTTQYLMKVVPAQ